LRRPRPTQGCRADGSGGDDDYDDDDNNNNINNKELNNCFWPKSATMFGDLGQ
jgi:hypothetical protein